MLDAIITAAILFFIYKLIVKPYFALLYYKKQGGHLIFHKELVSLPSCYRNANKYSDFHYQYSQIIKKEPQTPFFVENFASNAHVILVDPEMIKEFFQKYDIYQKDNQFYGLAKILGKGSLVFEEGASWRRRRRVLANAFSFEFLKNSVPAMIEAIQKNFAEWIKTGDLIDVKVADRMAMVTGDIVGGFVFGNKFYKKTLNGHPLSVGMKHLLDEVAMIGFTLPFLIGGVSLVKANILPRHKRLNKTIEDLRKVCLEMIEETEKSGLKEDTMLQFLLGWGENENAEDGLTNDDIVGEFIGVFGAGTDTSANGISVALYFLWKYPKIFVKVKEEINREIKSLNAITLEEINKLEFTTAFIKETFRLAGPISMFLARVASQDDNLCGVHIKKGTKINVFPDIFQKWDKYFSDPLEFDPERWMPNGPYNNDGFKKQSYAYIQFGAGPRNCVGQHLAMIEIRVFLALFINTFDFTFKEDPNFVMVQRFAYSPLNPLTATFKMKEGVKI